jgi:O-methyltransferase involved in polyketide biosynthesis
MKALKSQLATELLADPKARDQLRQFMTSKRAPSQPARQAVAEEFHIRRAGGQAVRASIVPKAKAA